LSDGRAEAAVEHRCTALPCGLTVASERVPAVRSVALGFWIAGGSAHEPEHEAGISHLLEHMLFRGTASYRSEQIDQIFDEMGSDLNAETDKDATSLTSRVLDTHLPRAFDVMSEMVFKPALDDLPAEREVVLQEIAAYEDDPQDQIFDKLAEAVFGEHPLARPVIGRKEVVGAIEREQLRAFHARRYVPGNVVVAAAGSVEHDELVHMALAACGERAAGPEGSGAGGEQPGPAARPEIEERVRVARRVRFQRKETEQYHVCLGAPGIGRADERRFALRVLEVALGGTPSSRLFQEVRERRGLAYAVYCFSALYASTGEVGIYVGTRPENLAESLAVIAHELARVCSEPLAEDELVRARECAKSALVLALESSGARMGRLGSALLFGLPVLSPGELIERIDAVRAEDCAALARELYAGARLSVAAIGPDEDAFRVALEPLDALAERPLAPAPAPA
jgi:predicted Zn-dependent peptidase